LDPAHPYARDLDLFRAGIAVRTALDRPHPHWRGYNWRAGCWRPADPATVRARQRPSRSCVRAWICARTWRWVAEESRTAVDPVSLAAWARHRGCSIEADCHAATIGVQRAGPAWASALAAYLLSLMGAFRLSLAVSILLRDVFLAALAVNANLSLSRAQADRSRGDAAKRPAHELRLLSEVLLRLERE